MWGWDHMGGYGGGWGMPFGWLFMILFWALLILGIVALVRWVMSPGHTRRVDEDRAMALLRERYARGDIDEQEYEQKKRMLEER